MKLCLFWALLGIDALISAIVAYFFFLGLADGSVSSFNAGIWLATWVALAVIIAGSLGLKALGHPVHGIMLLLILSVPGLFYGLFMVLIMVTNPRWN